MPETLIALPPVSHEQAYRLKKLGFDLNCSDYYFLTTPKHTPSKDIQHGTIAQNHNSKIDSEGWFDYCSAPSVSLALAWLWEKYKVFVAINLGMNNEHIIGFRFDCWDNLINLNTPKTVYQQPSEAQAKSLTYALDLVDTKTIK